MMAARWLAVIALAAGCDALFAAKSEPVVELDGETLEAALAAAPVAVVSFGAPWCAHCRRFEPQFLEAASAVRDAGLDVLFGSLDAAEDRAVADAYGVRGYPHVKCFRPPLRRRLRGPQRGGALARWAKRRARPAVSELADWPGARDFFGKLLDGALEALVRAAKGRGSRLRRDEFGAFADAVVVVEANDGDDVSVLGVDDATPASAMAAFVGARLTPLVTRFESAKGAALFYEHRGPAVHALLVVDEKSKRALAATSALADAAEVERSRVRHVVVPAAEERVLKHFSLDAAYDLPTVILCDMRVVADLDVDVDGAPPSREAILGTPRTYTFAAWAAASGGDKSVFDADDLLAFEAAMFAGELEPWLRSEPMIGGPATRAGRGAANAEGASSSSGKSFAAVVDFHRRDPASDADFFVLFHAPWCGHCASLAPTWEALARLYAPVDSVVVARMDATKNEIDDPGVLVDGFPTIYLFPADRDAKPALYEHAHDLDSFSRFLKERGTRSFDVAGLKGGGEYREEL
ncbi:hypothetical protein JL722_6653 [Aureococcus anophagefferens]|nr:hypothetical protein JL722_6653 [Aureococcus anophagefferens]